MLLRNRSPVLRGLGCALLVGCLLAELAGTAVELGAAHVRCAEHDELTHVSRSLGAPVDATEPTSNTNRIAGQADARNATHEHCPLAALLNQAKPTLKRPAGLTAPTEGQGLARGFFAADVPPALRAPIDVAPKTSPPA
jgi:hypothetical protein